MKELYFTVKRFYSLLKKKLKRTFDQTSLIRYFSQKKKKGKGTISTAAFDGYILHSSVITEEVRAIKQTYPIGNCCRNL
jgi:hypothetical protein